MSHNCVPISLKVSKERPVLVVGGGRTATSKVRLLLACGAVVTVRSPELSEDLARRVADGRLEWSKGVYEPSTLRAFSLVFACTDNPDVNRQVFADAAAARVPVNTADNPELCTFFMPATVVRGPLKVAVSTDGESPSLAARLRRELEQRLPPFMGAYTKWLGGVRERLKAMNTDESSRRRVLGTLTSAEGEDRFETADRSAQEAMLDAALRDATTNAEGEVWLVGAGPGHMELLTLWGLRCLERADAVLYDGLVNPAILQLARRDAAFYDTAKRAGCRNYTQAEINALMVRLAREGKRVCRLKGGDPCVFGRAGEEAAYLAKHNVRCTIVPGVTAAVAAPAMAGIPVTHRDHASYFQVVTGHEDPAKTESRVNWRDIGQSTGTVVFLMGAHRLSSIAEKLLQHGKPPQTGVAVICRGTLPDSRIFETTLEKASKNHYENQIDFPRPALIVVGDVVSLGPLLRGETSFTGEDRAPASG